MSNNRTDSERIAVIEDTVLQLQRQLFGNGRPGMIEKMEARMDTMSGRILNLEKLSWKAMGIIGICLVALEIWLKRH